VQRLVYALVNEGARILEDGIASKASDIDMVYLTGYGFPLWRGGPMKYADQVGLFNVAESMKRFARNPLDDASFWQPAGTRWTTPASGNPHHCWPSWRPKASHSADRIPDAKGPRRARKNSRKSSLGLICVFRAFFASGCSLAHTPPPAYSY